MKSPTIPSVRHDGEDSAPRNSILWRRPWFMLLFQCVLFVLLFSWVSLFVSLGLDPHHDGILLKPAIDVANGAVPFKETFSQYGLLMILIQAATVKIFGPSLLAVRFSAVFFYAVAGFFFWKSWRSFLSPSMATLGLFLWLALADFYQFSFLAWSSVYVLGAQAALMFTVIRYYSGERRWYYAVLSGSLVSTIFWIRLPVGILHAISLVVLIFLVEFYQFSKNAFHETLKSIALVLLGILLVCIHCSCIFGVQEEFWTGIYSQLRWQWFLERIYRYIGMGQRLNVVYGPSYAHYFRLNGAGHG